MRDRSIREGTVYQLNCMSMGGNPPATLKWTLAGSNKGVTTHLSVFFFPVSQSVRFRDTDLSVKRLFLSLYLPPRRFPSTFGGQNFGK